ncbi:hypothetical protein K9K77_01105 [Candidatus Babeliales bacterium]|nr:hypothetical protein [Candidatus Babeliales bacterium]
MKKRVYISGLFLAFSGACYGAEESKPAQGPQEESTTSTTSSTSQSTRPVPNFQAQPRSADPALFDARILLLNEQARLNAVYQRNALDLRAARERAKACKRPQDKALQDSVDINGEPQKKKVRRALDFSSCASEHQSSLSRNDRDNQGGQGGPAGGCAL